MSSTGIVVGIDFGTTYSGVSWAVNAGGKHIRLITDWPNPTASYRNPNSAKVPTLISYENGAVKKWGFDAAVADEVSLRWFKILLEPNHKYAKIVQEVADENKMLEDMNKSPQDVVTDYLRMLWVYTQEDIRKHKSIDWSDQSTKVVITVPAMWSETAKLHTKRAAQAAGLPNDVNLVSEPEAAAIAVFRDKLDKGDILKENDVFVVCDAGKWTVDLISYKIRKTDPLEIEECAPGTGALCGSAFVDIMFEKYVKTKVGEKQFEKIEPRYRKRMMLDFEVQVKRDFAGDDEKTYIELRGVDDNPNEGIVEENVILSGSTVRTIFDYVCNQIVQLVEGQIDEVEENGLKVKAVLLVGGFGASKYLHRRLENAKQIKDNKIQVIQNTDAWSSICRGATLWGLENSEREVAKWPYCKAEYATNSPNAVLVHEPSSRTSKVEACASLESEYENVLFNEEENGELDGVAKRQAQHAATFWRELQQFNNKHMRSHPRRKLGEKSGIPTWQNRNIKIALIDTGINLNDNVIAPERRRFSGKSWINEVEKFENPFHDTCGHGTHVARLVLKVTTVADILVAKVSKDKTFTEQNVSNIAEAITWAVEQGADIISLSLGFKVEIPEIKMALTEAITPSDDRVSPIVFAAAGNWGYNFPTPFPATEQGVFGIHAVNGQGIVWDSNTLFAAKDPIATLGVAIESFWNGERVWLSGTSFATPIAAGIAANVLEFAKQKMNLNQPQMRQLRSFRGMRAVLKLMCMEGPTFAYLSPWQLQRGSHNCKTDEDIAKKFEKQIKNSWYD